MEEAEAELLEDEEDNRKGKGKETDEEDEIALGTSRIRLLGDERSDADSSDDSGNEPEPLDPETVIEQAYLQDPSVFYRDANTRRGKARIELRNLTGWADEQIEGWKVILERTPGKKEKLEEKHAFSGNIKGLKVHVAPSRSGGYGGRGRGRTRGGATGDNGGESSRGFRRGGRGGGGSNRKRDTIRRLQKLEESGHRVSPTFSFRLVTSHGRNPRVALPFPSSVISPPAVAPEGLSHLNT